MKIIYWFLVFLYSIQGIWMYPRIKRQTALVNKPQFNACVKEMFIKSYIFDQIGDFGLLSGSPLYDEDYQKIRSICPEMKSKCHTWSGSMRLSIIEMIYESLKKLRVRFQLYDLLPQDCFGYTINWSYFDKASNKKIIQTKYFNFFEDFAEDSVLYDFPTDFGIRHNFTITAMPTGKSTTMIITAPTPCELKVLDVIYNKIQREDILATCDTMPSYDERRSVAETICSKVDEANVQEMMQDALYSDNCKLKVKLT